jgi:hypothetical protein
VLYLGHKLLDGRLGTRADLALHLPDDGTPDPPVPFGGASEDDHLAVTSCRRKSRAKSGEPAGVRVAKCIVDDHRSTVTR